MVDVLNQWGFRDAQIQRRFDCFRGTSKERTARQFGVHGANMLARKPTS